MLLVRVLAILLLLTVEALAGRGGHVTKFDPNLFGGASNVACLVGSPVASICTTAFSATCNGSGSGDDAALSAWVSYGHARGATQSILYIAPGANCVFGGTGVVFTADLSINCAGYGSQADTTVQNVVVWGYGATVNSAWFGGAGFYTAQDPNGIVTGCSPSGPTNTSPFIQAANAGDTTVTLVTASDSSNFVAGDYIVVTALANTTIGNFPPSHTFHEHALVTAVNGSTGVLSLANPLQFSYKTTYPNIGGTQPFQGGPATIYLLNKTFNTNAQFFGLTVASLSQTNIIGKKIVLQDITWSNPFANGPNPTASAEIWNIGGNYNGSEVDKDIDFLALINNYATQTDIQSSSINTFIVQGTTFNGTLNGTPDNTSISNSKFGAISVGPTCCGHGNSIALDGVTFTGATRQFHHSPISAYSFSSGTLTVAKSASEWTSGAGPGLWIPGMKYFMGDTDGSNTCSSANTFTVSDVVDAGSNVNIVTDIASIPVTNICNANSRPPSTFGAYQSMTVTQKFSGPANLLSVPEMAPP